MTNWPRQSEMNAFYGDPDSNDDMKADARWESANLVTIVPPYRMVAAWAPAQPIKGIRVHKRCAESLTRILTAVAKSYGSQGAIEAARMHLYGGCYNFRLMRGGSKLSIHSWGAAIDIDPERNGLGKMWHDNAGMMPLQVVKCFDAEGWTWGGRWKTGDAMHFQAASVG
jgi:hypothetical protein